MVLHTQTPPPQTSPPHTPPTQLTPPTPPPEPITSAQLARIAAYYEARKPYLALLYETMDDNITANAQNTTEKNTKSDKQKEEKGEVETEPKPGAHFGELVAQLKEARITNAAGGKKVVRRKL